MKHGVSGLQLYQHRWEKTVIHGHTPVRSVQVLSNRVNVDTGCVLGNLLSALELSTGEVFSVQRQALIQPMVLLDKTSRRGSVRFDGAVPVFVRYEHETIEFVTLNYSQF